jgi:MbtH protein
MRKALQLCSLAFLLSAGAAYAAKAPGSVAVPLRDDPTYKVVVNQEQQYSIWPADRENPLGWNDVGRSGTKEECLAYIQKIIEGMRPASAGSKTETARLANTPSPSDFQIPSLGQNGRAVEIKGPFDGDVRTTEIRIGGQLVTALAESSRNCFFIGPDQNLGPNEITIRENNVEARGTYRNIGVRLIAPKTNLLKGERTVVTITVTGVHGIKQNIPLLIEKKGAVSMEGGDVQTVQIRPNDVVIEGTEGRADVRRLVVGLRPGLFNIMAT